MRRFRIKKHLNIKKIILLIMIFIIITTSLFINRIGTKATNNILYISRTLVNTINTNTVNSNIKIELFKKYNMNNLISVNIVNNKVVNVDYNMDAAYQILIEIKKSIINNIETNLSNYYNYYYEVNNNRVVIEMPFYNYTNNVLIANLGPKIKVGLSMIRLIDGSVSTKITTYGLNSLLVELYINISITSKIVVPYAKEKDVTNNYNILLASKVIQGEIPSIYNGLYESKSSIISS